MSEVLFEIRGLKKSYWLEDREIPVLKGLDLDIRRGEKISIIGPSGSGKSTFLHILGTLDVPTEGQVLFQGQEIFRFKQGELASFRNRTIGFCFQFHHLLPEFTALENVRMPALIQRMGVAEADARAKKMLEIVNLSERLHHRPGELSGGEQQRVAIARALVLEPKILLADEPTGNLDESSARGIHALLDEMSARTGLTIILVTHSSTLAKHMPRQLLMDNGRLVTAQGVDPSTSRPVDQVTPPTPTLTTI